MTTSSIGESRDESQLQETQPDPHEEEINKLNSTTRHLQMSINEFRESVRKENIERKRVEELLEGRVDSEQLKKNDLEP